MAMSTIDDATRGDAAMDEAASADITTDPIRGDLVGAAVKLLHEVGATGVTARKVADTAGTSTMAVYSRFGDMSTLLDAVYVHGFELLEQALADVDSSAGLDELEQLGLAYRRFALANPALFALMFERPMPGFDPSPEVRTAALETTFGVLERAVDRAQAVGVLPPGEARHLGYLIWVGVHGTSALEATYAARRRLGEWFLDTDADGADAVRSVVDAVVRGLRTGSP